MFSGALIWVGSALLARPSCISLQNSFD
jgi:hypothetical protein